MCVHKCFSNGSLQVIFAKINSRAITVTVSTSIYIRLYTFSLWYFLSIQSKFPEKQYFLCYSAHIPSEREDAKHIQMCWLREFHWRRKWYPKGRRKEKTVRKRYNYLFEWKTWIRWSNWPPIKCIQLQLLVRPKFLKLWCKCFL